MIASLQQLKGTIQDDRLRVGQPEEGIQCVGTLLAFGHSGKGGHACRRSSLSSIGTSEEVENIRGPC